MTVSRPVVAGTRTPSGQGASRADARAPREGRLRERATDRDEAEEIVSKHYLPNRLHLSEPTALDMELTGLDVGVMTTGSLTYGQRVRQVTEEARGFHVNMPVRGYAVSTSGRADPVQTVAGQALVFSPDAPAEITWSADCVQLCLMIPRAVLEDELERLSGRPVRTRLRFDFGVARGRGADRLRLVLQLVAQELDQPAGPPASRSVARHLEGLVLDAVLLGQSHNYSDNALGPATRAPSGAVKRGVELIEERPAEPWTVTSLATELHLSVRALQAGFRREVGTAPMAFLRTVRLRRAHAELQEATPAETTVHTVARSLGLLHQGRFAADYRNAYGEMPSQTLRR